MPVQQKTVNAVVTVQYKGVIYPALAHTLTREAVFVNSVTASYYITELTVWYQVGHSQYGCTRKTIKEMLLFLHNSAQKQSSFK